MELLNEHVVRVIDQEIDTLEICPDYPDYMVIGTYSLVKPVGVDNAAQEEEDSKDAAHSIALRLGSLRVLPIDGISQPVPDHYSPCLDQQHFPCAILDIHFCPTNRTLLGAATSTGELRFFQIKGLLSEPSRRLESIYIIPLGIAQVSRDTNGGGASTPLVTQFAWLQDEQSTTSKPDDSKASTHLLAVCDTTGQTKLVQVSIPNPASLEKSKGASAHNQTLLFSVKAIHKHLHDLEAWTIHPITTSIQSNTLHQILLSGGDDSCLIASSYNINLADTLSDQIAFETPPAKVYVDKRNHAAGVVSILSLPSVQDRSHLESQSPIIPLLTGSYDQYIRLFLFNPATLKFNLVSELELEGGVWRIALLDTYPILNTRNNLKQQQQQQHHSILLVSAMHAGCYVVRLSHQFSEADSELGSWQWHTEARFAKPHESMVYACAARMITSDKANGRTWQVVSTSFYDKRICVWHWTDRMRKD